MVKWIFCLCKINLTESAVPRVCVYCVKTVAGNIILYLKATRKKLRSKQTPCLQHENPWEGGYQCQKVLYANEHASPSGCQKLYQDFKKSKGPK